MRYCHRGRLCESRVRPGQAAIFESQRPINRVLGFSHRLKFSGSLARYRMVPLSENVHSHKSPDALNYAEFYFSIFHR